MIGNKSRSENQMDKQVEENFKEDMFAIVY